MRTLLTLSFAALALTACTDSESATEPSAAVDPAATITSRDQARYGDDRDDDDDRDPGTKTYRVTITNLTSGQPLSPGVVVTHDRRISLFGLREKASEGIRAIAEDGNPSIAAAELEGGRGVFAVTTTTAPIGIRGGTAFPSTLSVEISARGTAKLLSLSLMLICTNDGFAGLDAVRLPRGNREVVYYADGYDAGTERNTEVAASIVPPCFGIGPVQGPVGGGDRTPENGRVRHHRGIRGIADLTSAHDWRGPVARIAVQRIR